MGAVYRPKYKAADGASRESAVWWIRFRQHGKTVRQSTEMTSHAKATAFLKQQEGKVALKISVNVNAERLTLKDVAELMRRDYEANGRKSASTLEYRLAHVFQHFGEGARLSRITTGAIETYKTERLKMGAKPATLNRELACFSRMATLARKQYGLVTSYVVDGLEERNARQGFFEDDAFKAVCQHLPDYLAALAAAARITGWRKSELRSRQWRHVDFEHGWLRLEPEETKNREGRQFPLIPELRALLDVQRVRVDAIQKETGQVVPWIFCRDDGQPVGDFKKAWASACVKAGFFRVVDEGEAAMKKPTRIFHDFRRTAVRNLVRAGIPETIAMRMTGHRTSAVFKRYAIVDEGMLREAGEKLVAALASSGRSKVGPKSGKVAMLKG